MDTGNLIFIMQFGIWMIVGFMFVLVLVYVGISSKLSKNTKSTIDIKYKNGETKTFENNYEGLEEIIEEEDDGPIKHV